MVPCGGRGRAKRKGKQRLPYNFKQIVMICHRYAIWASAQERRALSKFFQRSGAEGFKITGGTTCFVPLHSNPDSDFIRIVVEFKKEHELVSEFKCVESEV